MGQHTKNLQQLHRGAEDHVLRRAIAARLDRALQRAATSFAKAAKWLSVTQDEVDFWRRGITVPPFHAFTRIAATLQVDVPLALHGPDPTGSHEPSISSSASRSCL